MAAWNSTNVDGTLMYSSGNRMKRKRDLQGTAQCSKVMFTIWLHCCQAIHQSLSKTLSASGVLQAKKMLDLIGKGPNGVPHSRLFEYMLFLCKVTDHRLEELNPDAAPAGASADMESEQLAPREVLENDQHIEQDLQWCVKHRLMAEVIILGPCYIFAS